MLRMEITVVHPETNQANTYQFERPCSERGALIGVAKAFADAVQKEHPHKQVNFRLFHTTPVLVDLTEDEANLLSDI